MANFKTSLLFGAFIFAMALHISSQVGAEELAQQEHDNDVTNSNLKQNLDNEDFSIGLHFGPGIGGQGGIGRGRGGIGIGYGRGYGGGYGGIGGYGGGYGGYGRRYGRIGYGRGRLGYRGVGI